MGTFRPTAQGGTIATTDSVALALIDVRGLPPGTRVFNEAVGHMFALTTSTAALVPNVVVEVFGIVGARWILDTSDADVASVTGTAPISVDNTDPHNPIVSLAASGVTAATYNLATVTVDATGRVTAASSNSDTGITQLTGDGTAGPGSGSQALTLATVNGNVGSFTAANITVNAKGLITAAANGTGGVTQLTGDVTAGPGSGSVAATLAAGSASVLNSGTLNASRLPALTGDVTTSAGSAATTLAAGSASVLNSGTLPDARMPALTGDVTTSAGAVATTLAHGNAANLDSGTLNAARLPAFTGDVTTSGGSAATTLAAGSASNLNSGTLAVARLPVAGRVPPSVTAQGLIAQTFPRQNRGIATNVIVNGSIYFCMVDLFAGQTVTSISVVVTTKSTSATLAKVALYSKTGTQLGVSASVHATYNNAAGLYTTNLGTPYPVVTDDGYYLAFLTVGGTAPVLLGAAGALTGDQAAVVGSGYSPLGVQTGQSDMTSPATITTGSSLSVSIWLGAS